jgi:hypothetical protein
MGLLPITAASVELTFIGFMKAAFGLRLAAGFLAFAAGRLVAAFFIGFLAAGFLAAGFFDAFLPFLDAIDESSNLMVTLSSVHLASVGATARGCARGKHLSTVFTLEKAFFHSDVSLPQQPLNARNHSSSAFAASTSSFSMASRGAIPAAAA